jgi:hypothetical protein
MESSRNHHRAGTASVLAALTYRRGPWAESLRRRGTLGTAVRGGIHRTALPGRAGRRHQPAGGGYPDRSAAHAVAGARSHNGPGRDHDSTTDVGSDHDSTTDAGRDHDSTTYVGRGCAAADHHDQGAGRDHAAHDSAAGRNPRGVGIRGGSCPPSPRVSDPSAGLY